MHPHVELRRDLGTVGVTNLRPAHGAEKHRVGGLAGLHRAVRKRVAGVAVEVGAAGAPVVLQLEAVALLHRLEQRQRRVDDLDADAVARQHHNVEIALHGPFRM
jgi:hypothetical protein